jgi:hypothetical protein
MSRFYDPERSEFIQLSGGLEYVKKFEIVGLRWSQYMVDGEGLGWCLKVYFSEAAHMIAYGDDARTIMMAFDLPPDPPGPRSGAV